MQKSAKCYKEKAAKTKHYIKKDSQQKNMVVAISVSCKVGAGEGRSAIRFGKRLAQQSSVEVVVLWLRPPKHGQAQLGTT